MIPLFRIFLSTILKASSIPSLMYWQQTKILPQYFTPELELLGEEELLHNILPKFGACRMKLINLTSFLMRLSPDQNFLSFPGFV